MELAKVILPKINNSLVSKPDAAILQLPEKVLQFGTGVLLRGLPGYYIDRANKAGLFNGRIVVVKSTGGVETNAYEKQNGLYTHCLKGLNGEKLVEEYIINASISRVLAAATAWHQVLLCAENPAIEVIVSNTTEVGLVLHRGDKITDTPPQSFPGKLLALLYRRYQFFNGNPDKGLVILPTELLSGNGDLLKGIVQQLAKENELCEKFMRWLSSANHFCNTLVDRIVPGKLPFAQQQETESILGYHDALMIMSETYGLWAIEAADEKVRETLAFADADSGCVVTDDIYAYRELKLRLLNATHTFVCAWALQSGFDTVREAMNDAAFNSLVEKLMQEEIIPCIIDEKIGLDAANSFAASVLDRFRNPYIQHNWTSITLNYTQKLRLRCIPLIVTYYKRFDRVPEIMAKLFASYLAFMDTNKQGDDGYYAVSKNGTFLLQDEATAYFYDSWKAYRPLNTFTDKVLGNTALWATDLGELTGFAKAVSAELQFLATINKNEQPAVQGIP